MRTADCFIDLLSTPLGRRGSYLAFAGRNGGSPQFGKTALYLMTCKGGLNGMNNMGAQNTCRQVSFALMKDGQRLPTVISTTESEVLLQSDYGEVRFCIAGRNLAMCRGEDGLSLRISIPRGPFGSGALRLWDDVWKSSFGEGYMLYLPFCGKLQPQPDGFVLAPDESGILELGLEEYEIDPACKPLSDYPRYADCVAAFEREFNAFCDSLYPALPAEFESMRRQALMTTWSLMVDEDDGTTYRHTMLKMMRIVFENAFGWQQAMQSIFLHQDIRLAWNILFSCFDHQDANGRIADSITYRSGSGNSMKPPFQGVALKWLMDHCDLSPIPLEEKQQMYSRMAAWTEFFYRFRDLDGDGIWENHGAVETGWEDGTYFYIGFPLASPDMNAYSVIMMDALAQLGSQIGIDPADCAAWTKRADALTQKIIEKFWTGERWVVWNPRSGAVADSLSLPMFAALILGKRLPQEILDKTVDFIYSDKGFVTPFGFSSESVNSPRFAHGFTGGSVIAPAQLILCLALEAAGKPELAKEMGLRYARTLRDNGFFHIINALDGSGERGLVAFGEKELFWSSWASSCYLFFADRYGK